MTWSKEGLSGEYHSESVMVLSLTAQEQTAQLCLSVIPCLLFCPFSFVSGNDTFAEAWYKKALLSYLLKRFLQIDLNCQVHLLSVPCLFAQIFPELECI